MSIATTSLKYGWKVLAILTIGTGSIFVAGNVLNRITTKDRIEVTLAVVERCYATQTGTNPATYGVDPPVIVRTWTDANGASVVMTNALEWMDDLSMKVELDAKIKALVPYYADTNTMDNLTVTGLWASLGIGDGTNQFTATPCWTNNVGETNCTTNSATFGPWAWRNYVVAWQERYKVLNALKTSIGGVPACFGATKNSGYKAGERTNWAEARAGAESNFVYINSGYGDSSGTGGISGLKIVADGSAIYSNSFVRGQLFGTQLRQIHLVSPFSTTPTSILHKINYYYRIMHTTTLVNVWGYSGEHGTIGLEFDDNGTGLEISDSWKLLIGETGYSVDSTGNVYCSIGSADAFPVWGDEPVFGEGTHPLRGGVIPAPQWNKTKGIDISFSTELKPLIEWDFQYCTNEYW